MSAKEMFEELGYELMLDCKYYIYYQKPLKENPEYESDYFHISFEKLDKAFIKTYGDDNSPEITNMQELKAINQQCKELGWINE